MGWRASDAAGARCPLPAEPLKSSELASCWSLVVAPGPARVVLRDPALCSSPASQQPAQQHSSQAARFQSISSDSDDGPDPRDKDKEGNPPAPATVG